MELQIPTADAPIILLPCSIANLKELRTLLVELQSYWLEQLFAVADVAIEHHELMGRILELLPVKGQTGAKVDFTALRPTYQDLERIFFIESADPVAVHGWSRDAIAANLDRFPGCWLTKAHVLNPRALLAEADQLRVERLVSLQDQLAIPLEAVSDAG